MSVPIESPFETPY